MAVRAAAARVPRAAKRVTIWEGTAAGELRIQKCNACGELRHPPGPVCPSCHAMDRGYVVASGRGTVHSFLVHHAPAVPGKKLPLTVALIDLEEGVRMIGEVSGEVAIGDPVEVWFDRIDDEVTLAQWRRPIDAPSEPPAPESTSDLPVWDLPLTPTLIVSTALATRDFQDVHHDRDLAIGHGSKDIFMNILTTNGLSCSGTSPTGRGPDASPVDVTSDWARPTPVDTMRLPARDRQGRRPDRGDRVTRANAGATTSPARAWILSRRMSGLRRSGRDRRHRRHRVLQGVRPQELRLAVEAVAGRPRRRRPRRPPTSTGWHLHHGHQPGDRHRPDLGMGELTFFSRIHYGGGAACATVQQAAMAVAPESPTSWCATGPSTSGRGHASAPACRAGRPGRTPRRPLRLVRTRSAC